MNFHIIPSGIHSRAVQERESCFRAIIGGKAILKWDFTMERNELTFYAHSVGYMSLPNPSVLGTAEEVDEVFFTF